ncbi:hypothetical protein EJB05_52429 [Eragrostis curvula]|uniref:Uncharacterized protein n=1 Tax=Eragrostis curvula TaxID=38414 RepID=A0A5J9SSQ1_9POAL|nr:hypothetical protein EJB05_52429 [Eragrostis curvula]
MEEDHDENNTSRLLFDTNLVLVCEKKDSQELNKNCSHASATTVVTLSGSKIWKTRSPLHSHAAQKPKMTVWPTTTTTWGSTPKQGPRAKNKYKNKCGGRSLEFFITHTFEISPTNMMHNLVLIDM